MSNIRKLRKKIKSIKQTQQITKAMKMIATVRLYRAQNNILNSRPFAIKMYQMMNNILNTLENIPENVRNFFISTENKKIGILLITSDRGLCGSYNNNLINKAIEFINFNKERPVFFIVGKKGRDYFLKSDYAIEKEYINIFNNLCYAHAEIISNDILEYFLNKRITDLFIVYSEFKSILKQEFIIKQLLPIKPEEIQNNIHSEFIFEPQKEILLETLVPRYIKSQIYRVLLESLASELASRMTSMDQASKNAQELINSLTLEMNKVRQSLITTQILDIIGTKEAIK